MKAKKFTVILIAILFALAVLTAVFFIFTIKKIDVSYSITEDYDNSQITETLNSFEGKNLLFFDLEQVEESLEKFPDLKIISIEKKYPGIIKISIAERLPVFNLAVDNKTYTLDKEGVIIKITDGKIESSRETIDLLTEGVSIIEPTLGQRVVCSDQVLFDSAILMANNVDLTDSIKTINVKSDGLGELKDVEFLTYTGVKITITKADQRPKDKILEAFKSYDSVTVDFIKSYSEILVYVADDGNINVDWIS